MYSEPTIYILVPVYNRAAITLEFVDCLQKQTFQNFKLILIDDGSVDDTAGQVRQLLPETLVLQGDGNLWWAGCLNKGINWLQQHDVTSDSIILIINDDVLINQDFLKNGIETIKKNDKTLLLARQENNETGAIEETGVKVDLQHFNFYKADNQEEINCLSTRGLFLRWADLKNIGKLKSGMLPHYGSDYEFTMRAYRQDYKLMTSNNVYLQHDIYNNNLKFKKKNRADLRFLFSNKCDINPVMLSKLAILISPVYLLPLNIFRIWYRTIKYLTLTT